MDQEQATALAPEAPCMGDFVYTTGEVSKLLKVPRRTVQDWVKSGALSAVQYGKHLRIRPRDLAAFGKVRNPRPDDSVPADPASE